MAQGSASTVINRPASEVFDALSDVTRMGEWSPECTGGRWVAPATGPAVGAKFEGDNIVKIGPITLKKWTTTSEITEYVPDELFGFVTEGYTRWRYEFRDHGGATSVTETFDHEPHAGWQKFVYDTMARRSGSMVKGLQQTLARMKETLEH
ncbi:MAG: SRPBCC family protein [Acidimicrobiales bacterium]